MLPAGAGAQAASTTAPTQPGAAPGSVPPPPPAPAATFREAASVIANPETGILNIRATSRQHEKVQEFLDQVMTSAKRQVLIEATVAEVQLNNEYQRGIDWQRLRTSATSVGVPSFGTGNSGLEFGQSLARHARRRSAPNAFVFGGAITSLNFNFALKLLESFGDVRVLSSPKISVLNNQTAVLKVVDNLVYFTVAGADHARHRRPASARPPSPPPSTRCRSGFIMSVVPQISEADIGRAQRAADDLAQDRRRRRPEPRPRRGRRHQPDPGDPDARDGIGAARAERPDRGARRADAGRARAAIEDGIPGVHEIPGLGDAARAAQGRRTRRPSW